MKEKCVKCGWYKYTEELKDGDYCQCSNRKYQIIYADPPWIIRKGGKKSVRPNSSGEALDYPVITLDEIKNIKTNRMKNILFIDTETTGTGEKDRLCQLAIKRLGDEEALQWMFKPPVPVSFEAMSITHITNEMLEDCVAFADSHVKSDLQKSFDGSDILVAHNADFDMKMLKREGMKLPVRYICTMKIAHWHDKEAELGKHNLQYLRYFFGLKFDKPINPHDARSDVLVLEALFNHYCKYYTIDQMIEISSRPILLKKMMFGKYKDKFFKEIIVTDRDYMEWMWKNMEMDENLKYTVAYYLKGHHRTNKF